MKTYFVVFILFGLCLAASASEESLRPIVERASQLCNEFKEDRLCFIQCKNYHMIQLGNERGISNVVNLEDCFKAAESCSSFGVEALQRAKLDSCSPSFQEGIDAKHASKADPLSKLPAPQSTSQLCKGISLNNKLSISTPGLFVGINFKAFPTKQRTTYSCGNGGFCFKLNETLAFSCANVTTLKPPINPISCDIAKKEDIFPFCPALFSADPGCQSLECCSVFNQQAANWFNDTLRLQDYQNSFFMKFLDANGKHIHCSSFENGATGNRCIQTYMAYGSSNFHVCSAVQVVFDKFGSNPTKLSNDDLSFSLFD